MTDNVSLDRKKTDRILMLLDLSIELAKVVNNLVRLSIATKKLAEFNIELQTMTARLKLKESVDVGAGELQDAAGKEKGLYLAVDNSPAKDAANR